MLRTPPKDKLIRTEQALAKGMVRKPRKLRDIRRAFEAAIKKD
jgi:hypothetical protein